jgi:hypothetical protein
MGMRDDTQQSVGSWLKRFLEEEEYCLGAASLARIQPKEQPCQKTTPLARTSTCP